MPAFCASCETGRLEAHDVEPAVTLAWELGDPVIGAIGERGLGPGAAKRTSGEEQRAKLVQATRSAMPLIVVAGFEFRQRPR